MTVTTGSRYGSGTRKKETTESATSNIIALSLDC